MGWKKIKKGIEMWEEPCLGTVEAVEGERFMALCVDPSSKNPYRGIARHVYQREGSEDVPGFVDHSKLVIVESDDLLKWRVVKDLEIKGIDEVVFKLNDGGEKEFIGLEDPDIFVDEKSVKHVYFTIPLKHSNKEINDVDGYDVYIGHAKGADLDSLEASTPVLGAVSEKIVGFKEMCPSPILSSGERFVLVESFVRKKGGDGGYSAIGIARAKKLSGKWEYLKLVHDPDKETRGWCAGHSSPCRILNPELIKHDGKLVGIMNGREKTIKIEGVKRYKKFRPGLFLFDDLEGKMVWVDDAHLLEDPESTTVTFASEFVPYDGKHGLLYAHPNDSFVRAYKISYDYIRSLLPEKI